MTANAHIKEVMTASCQWIAPTATIAEAAKKMKQDDIGFLPVGENDKLIGTITDRDIAIKCVAAGQDPATTKVSACMNKKLFYCYDDQPVNEICENMAQMAVSRFPVVSRAKRLVGVVSYADLSAAANANAYLKGQRELKSVAEAAPSPAQKSA